MDVWVCPYLTYARYHLLILLTDDKASPRIAMIMTQDISIIRPDLIARIHALCEGEDDPLPLWLQFRLSYFMLLMGMIGLVFTVWLHLIC